MNIRDTIGHQMTVQVPTWPRHPTSACALPGETEKRYNTFVFKTV